MAKSGKKAKSGKAKGFSTKKAGLKFSPGAIGGNLKRGRFAKRVSKAAAVYLASAIEYSVWSVPSTARLRGGARTPAIAVPVHTRALVPPTRTLYCTSELLELATKVAAKAKKTTLREVLCNRDASAPRGVSRVPGPSEFKALPSSLATSPLPSATTMS